MTPEDTKRVFGDELNTEAIHQGIQTAMYY